MLLEGLQLPLTTPFYSDGRLNLLKLEHNAERYSKTPVAGLVALSESGEASMLSDEETRMALRSAIGAAAPEKVMIAGVSRDSLAGTLELAEAAAEFGYDAVLVKRPSILRAELVLETITYFQMIADRSALPVVLYGIGVDTNGMLSDEAIAELAGHSRILGLVDNTSSQERMARLKAATSAVKRDVTVTAVFAAVTRRMQTQGEDELGGGLISANTLTDGGSALAIAPSKLRVKTRTKTIGFQVLVEGTQGMLEGLKVGAVGAMPPFAAAAPQACYEVLAAWKDGDEGLAEEKQARLRGVAERVEKELGVAGIKFGCDLNGYFGGVPRLPLLPLTGGGKAGVEALMQGLRN